MKSTFQTKIAIILKGLKILERLKSLSTCLPADSQSEIRVHCLVNVTCIVLARRLGHHDRTSYDVAATRKRESLRNTRADDVKFQGNFTVE